jgi:hypothetical protein
MGKLADKMVAYLAPVIETIANLISDSIEKITSGLKIVTKTFAQIGFWVGDSDASLEEIFTGETWEKAGKEADKLFRSTAAARIKDAQEQARITKEAAEREIGAKETVNKIIAKDEEARALKSLGKIGKMIKADVDAMFEGTGPEAVKEKEFKELTAQSIDPMRMKLGGIGGTDVEQKQLETQSEISKGVNEMALYLKEMKNGIMSGAGPDMGMGGAVFGIGAIS